MDSTGARVSRFGGHKLSLSVQVHVDAIGAAANPTGVSTESPRHTDGSKSDGSREHGRRTGVGQVLQTHKVRCGSTSTWAVACSTSYSASVSCPNPIVDWVVRCCRSVLFIRSHEVVTSSNGVLSLTCEFSLFANKSAVVRFPTFACR